MVRNPVDDNVDFLTIKHGTSDALVAADRRDFALDSPPSTARAMGKLPRPKSPTFMLACKHIGTNPEALLEREPGPEVHSLPDDVVRLRLQHEERRRRQLVARVRSKYEELKLAEEQRAVKYRPASASLRRPAFAAADTAAAPSRPSSARPLSARPVSGFERQMTRLQRAREEKMAQWLIETERRAQLELSKNLEADAARARLLQLKAVRQDVRRAQANNKFLEEAEQHRDQEEAEAQRCALQMREYEGEQRKRRAEAEARSAAQRAARQAQEAAKRATQARRAETRQLRQQQEENDWHKHAAMAQRREGHAQQARAEEEARRGPAPTHPAPHTPHSALRTCRLTPRHATPPPPPRPRPFSHPRPHAGLRRSITPRRQRAMRRRRRALDWPGIDSVRRTRRRVG